MNISTTGYLNNSPHRFNNKNIIPSNLITMDNVNIPLLLRPNKGKSRIVMPNSGEYKFPKADFVTEIPLGSYQPGGSYFDKRGFHYKNIYNTNLNTDPLNDCPEGYVKDETGQCMQDTGFNPAQYQNKGMPIIPRVNSNGQMVGGTGATSPSPDNIIFNNENQGMKLKRIFGTPNIPAIIAGNLLSFGLSSFANNVEQGRQAAFMHSQMNNSTFNGTYSNAQNDYGVDPYEQTGQLRALKSGGNWIQDAVNPAHKGYCTPMTKSTCTPARKRFAMTMKKHHGFHQQGGLAPITVNDPNDPRLRAYNDSLKMFNATKGDIKALEKIRTSYPNGSRDAQTQWLEYTKNWYNKPGMSGVDKAFENLKKLNGQYPQPVRFSYLKNSDGTDDIYNAGKEYKKPVQPIMYQTEPKLKRIKENDGRLNYVNAFSLKHQSPSPSMFLNLQAPNLEQTKLDLTKPTKFAFTYADYAAGQSNPTKQQKSIYFPDLDTLRTFSKGYGIEPSYGGDNSWGQALYNGNIKYQRGGQFNPVDYLYGDEDTVDTPNKNVTEKVKQKRITEEDIGNNDSLANDVLNMDSVIGGRGRYRNVEGNSDYVSMYLKHQQGEAGYQAIEKAAQQGLASVPRNWNKENIQANMQRNVGKDFKGQLTPQSFINYWANKFNNHMQIAANKQTPYDSILSKVGQEEGIDPLFLKTVANIESGLNPNNNTGSKYKGLFAMNSKSFKGNIFDPYQNSKAAAQNFKKYEQGGEYELSEEEITDLINKGYKIEKL